MTAVQDIPRGKIAAPKPAAAASHHATTVAEIPLDLIDVGPNVRVTVGELDDLVASIKEHGVLQPIKVKDLGDRWQVVWGQRRFLAAKEAGLARIPALIETTAKAAHEESIEQLVENLVRADLNPIDEAKALRQVLDADRELTQDELAKRLGRSAPWVSNTLRLLELAPVVQQLVADEKLSQSHAKAIAGLATPATQVEVAERAVKYDYSAKQVEIDVKYRKANSTTEPERKEQIRKKSERLAKKMLTVLVAAGIPKDADLLSLSSYDTDAKIIAAALKAAGYAGRRDGYPIGSYGYKPDEIGCDCNAYRWETYPAPTFTRCCVNKAHVDAYEAQKGHVEAQRKKDLRDKAKRLTAVLERGLAGIDATTGRLAIAAIFGSNLTYHLSGTNGKGGDPWLKLEAIADDAMAHELAELIASTLIPTDQYARTDSSAGLASTINKVAAAPAKKAAA